MAGCPVLLFFQVSYLFLYFEQISYIFLYFWKKLIINPRKSCFHRNLLHLPMSFWGPGGPQTPAELKSLIFSQRHSVLSSQRDLKKCFSLYIEATKKFGQSAVGSLNWACSATSLLSLVMRKTYCLHMQKLRHRSAMH